MYRQIKDAQSVADHVRGEVLGSLTALRHCNESVSVSNRGMENVNI